MVTTCLMFHNPINVRFQTTHNATPRYVCGPCPYRHMPVPQSTPPQEPHTNRDLRHEQGHCMLTQPLWQGHRLFASYVWHRMAESLVALRARCT